MNILPGEDGRERVSRMLNTKASLISWRERKCLRARCQAHADGPFRERAHHEMIPAYWGIGKTDTCIRTDHE